MIFDNIRGEKVNISVGVNTTEKQCNNDNNNNDSK